MSNESRSSSVPAGVPVLCLAAAVAAWSGSWSTSRGQTSAPKPEAPAAPAAKQAATDARAKTVPSADPFNRSGFDRAARDRAAKARLREGTHIVDRLGYFELEGDAATFVTHDGFRMGGLPNLNLERVVRTLKTVGPTDRVQWSVSGSITEFNGRNHLLIDRAVYKAASDAAVN